jgi:perosamine synthetase
MIPVARPDIGEEEIALVSETIRSGWITQGPRVAEFERAFAARVGAPHAIAVSNCTAALHLTLSALGIGPADEVVVPSHTFIATANAVLHCGASPIFADIDPSTLNLDPAAAEAAIGPKTRAILVVHQVGRPAPLREFAALARKRGLLLVEDAACAIGSEYQGTPIGAPGFSAAACFSFHPRKVLSTGDGGMITTADDALAAKLRLLRQHGMSVNDLARHQARTVVTEAYPIVGYNYRLTDIQAAVGIVQLQRLDAMLKRRRALATRYDVAFATIPGIDIFREPENCRSNQQTYLIRLREATADSRDRLMQALLDEGISTRRGVMSVHREPCYRERRGPHSLEHSEAASDQCLCLPLYAGMGDTEVDTVIAAVQRHVSSA